MNAISLESLISSGCFHLSAASLFGHWLLSWQDRRRLAAVPKIVLSGISLVASLRSAAYTEGTSQRVAWIVCSLVALVALVQSIRQWISSSPAQLHDEAQQLNVSKTKLKKEADKKSKAAMGSWARSQIPRLIGSLVALGCLLYVKHSEFWSLASPDKYFAGLGVIGTTLMLGVALFLCFELTLISTPDALNAINQTARVNWRAVANLTLLIALVLLACCLAQFLQRSIAENLDSDERMVHVAARVFGLMLLLATFVVWMVPRRLANYQRSNSIPKDWVSLTLTAWLGMLAFLVVTTLPANWPWRVLMK